MSAIKKGVDINKVKTEHTLATRDLKVISSSLLKAFRNLEKEKTQSMRTYWKKATNYWLSILEEVLKERSPDYLLVDVIERAKTEFMEKLNILRGLDEDGINTIIDDLTNRFEVICETTRVNDMSAVKLRIDERIREINTKILIAENMDYVTELKAILKELIGLNNLIPR